MSERKVEVLERLEMGEKTPTELSEEMDLSISSITKHLNDLEERSLVKKSGKKKGKTRSYWKYELEDFVEFIASIDGEVIKGKIKGLNETQKVYLRIWSLPQPRFHNPLERFWLEAQEDIENIDAIMVYGSVSRGDAREDSDIDVLFISGEESLEDEYGAKMVGEKMFMAKRFSEEEFEENLAGGSGFAHNVINEGRVIYDPEDILKRWKDEYKEQTG